MATLCREIAMPLSVLVCLAAFGSADIGNTDASVAERTATPPTTDTALAVRPPPIAFGAADVAAATRSMTEKPAEALTNPTWANLTPAKLSPT
jgi:hypothetical protein